MIHCNSLGSPYERKSVFSTKKYVVPFNAGKPTPVTYSKFHSKVVVVLLFFIHCLLLLTLWGSVFVPCFIMQCYVSFLTFLH